MLEPERRSMTPLWRFACCPRAAMNVGSESKARGIARGVDGLGPYPRNDIMCIIGVVLRGSAA